MAKARPARRRLPFRAVNQPDMPEYDPDLQRHHLLPRQLLARSCFGRLFDALGHHRTGFDDFRRNGLLLPAAEKAAVRIGLPLHRGPHRAYNGMVAERVGQIESEWARRSACEADDALIEAHMRLALLQAALRRRLLDMTRNPVRLNKSDPLGAGRDFAHLDAMADLLWGETSGPAP